MPVKESMLGEWRIKDYNKMPSSALGVLNFPD